MKELQSPILLHVTLYNDVHAHLSVEFCYLIPKNLILKFSWGIFNS